MTRLVAMSENNKIAIKYTIHAKNKLHKKPLQHNIE